jgi:hypothetical protein
MEGRRCRGGGRGRCLEGLLHGFVEEVRIFIVNFDSEVSVSYVRF